LNREWKNKIVTAIERVVEYEGNELSTKNAKKRPIRIWLSK